MSLSVLTLMACAQPPATADGPAVSDPVPDEPAAYVTDDPETPGTGLTGNEVAVALVALFDVVFTLSGAEPVAVHDTLFDAGDSYCPYAYPVDGAEEEGIEGALWYGGCTAESGASYEGYGYRLAYRDYEVSGQVYNGDAVFGQADMISPSGQSFRLGGTAYDLEIDVPSEQYTSWINLVEGSFSWEGTDGLETWLGGDLAPALTLQAVYSDLYQGNLLILDGGVTGFDGAIDTVVMDNLTFVSRSLGNSCPGEPGGVLSLRDADGEWIDLFFDGPAEIGAPVDADACDGCGTLYHRGEVLGTACADLSDLLDWTSQPW